MTVVIQPPTAPATPAAAVSAPRPARTARVGASLGRLIEFERSSTWSRRRTRPGIADFTFGNPHEMPLPGFVTALQAWSQPLNKDWFAYKLSEPEAQEVVSAALRARTGVTFEPQDIAMTTGAFGALAAALHALCEPGDEVIINLPPWMCYEALIEQAGATTVKIDVSPDDYDLDLDAIERAITPRTRVVIVNTPSNPTGRIYPAETLRRLAALLANASARNGRPIVILSDEPYARIVFDGARPVSPAEFYPDTLIAYSYGKVLLTPGQRIGYLAISPLAREREALREAVLVSQIGLGWAFPNALLQHAIADLEELSIDIAHLQRKRDRMVAALTGMGYELRSPEGTFYLLVRSPLADDIAFSELLARHDVFVMPGSVFEIPGHFRISLTASEEMIERALPCFAEAREEAWVHGVIDGMTAEGHG